jgi:hypothetical protein
MKLEEFVTKIYDERPELGMTPFFDPILNSKVLEEVKDELLKFDVFSECDDLEIVHFPTFKVGDDKVFTTQTYKYSEGVKFKGKGYLYSIYLTPELYDPSKMLEPVKNGAAISPAIYNPMTFEPTKHILLTWSPEMAQDLSVTKDETTLRNDIHKLLDDVLDNPEEYRMKGTRHIMIRGVFEIVNDERKFEPNYLVGTTQESDTFTGYYMVKEKGSNDKESLYIKSKQIPKKLKESFIEKFTEEGRLKETTEEELNQFLEENK